MLELSYGQKVLSRNGSLKLDDDTRMNIGRVARWLTDEVSKPMLLLYGGYGNGKTTMARAVVLLHESVRASLRERLKRGFRDPDDREYADGLLSCVAAPRFCTAQWLATSASDDRQAFERAAVTKFLVIDDLGCEPVSVKSWGTEITPVTDILYRRYDDMLPTIVTTNLSKKDIRVRYGDRVADRFNETFETIGYTNASYRR